MNDIKASFEECLQAYPHMKERFEMLLRNVHEITCANLFQ